MNELITSLKAQLYDRTTSPLSGAFVLSWALWNYKMLLVVFSNMEIDEKLDYISTFLYQTSTECLTTGLLYPLLTTVFFIFIYPYPAKFVYEFWRGRQKDLKEIRQKIEDETPLTLEESRAIRRNALDLEIAFEKELERKDSEIRRLKDDLGRLGTTPSNIAEEGGIESEPALSSKNIKLNKDHLDTLQIIADLGGGKVYGNHVLGKSKHNKVKTEFFLGELNEAGLVTSSYSGTNQDYVYGLTHKGRTALVNDNRF